MKPEEKLRDRLSVAGGIVALGAAAFATYLFILRPRHLQWGTTRAERERALPGDEIVTHPTLVTNRALTIEAPPEEIWPWLAQMGDAPRGGYYSYAWIERMLGMQITNAERILPEYQHLEVGDLLDRSGGMRVHYVEPNHCLVLGPSTLPPWGNCTWCLALIPLDAKRTRLISRVRIHYNGWTPQTISLFCLLDPGQFLMERKMLLTLKQRVEQKQVMSQ